VLLAVGVATTAVACSSGGADAPARSTNRRTISTTTTFAPPPGAVDTPVGQCAAPLYPTFREVPDGADVSAQDISNTTSIRVGTDPDGAIQRWVTVDVRPWPTPTTEPAPADGAPPRSGERVVHTPAGDRRATFHEMPVGGPERSPAHVLRQYDWAERGVAITVQAYDTPLMEVDALLRELELVDRRAFDAYLLGHEAELVCTR
jgi:hypothetical protein